MSRTYSADGLEYTVHADGDRSYDLSEAVRVLDAAWLEIADAVRTVYGESSEAMMCLQEVQMRLHRSAPRRKETNR